MELSGWDETGVLVMAWLFLCGKFLVSSVDVLYWCHLPADVSLEDLPLHYSVDHQLDLLFCANSGQTYGSGAAS